ncbi:MAG: hypothetical protein RIB97_13095 [Nitratireductor sp.]
MSKKAHTPGPWEYNDPKTYTQGHGRFSETAVYAPGVRFPWRMAEIQGPDKATEIATARLIAAAPELVTALEKLLAVAEMTTFSDQYPAECEFARAAISKATGGE